MFASRRRSTTLIVCCLYLVLVYMSTTVVGLTRLTKNDPYPLYTTAQPFDFLTLCKRKELKTIYGTPLTNFCTEACNLNARVAFSPFRQTANIGQNIFENESELGDLTGRWNLIGLFYDNDKRRVLINDLQLDVAPTFTICNRTFIADPASSSTCLTDPGFNYITDPIETDTKFQFGFLSVPIEYRKYGVRFQTDIALYGNYSLTIKGGIANIYQQPEFIDLTCTATGLTCPVRDCNQQGDGGAACNNCCCPPVDPTAAADSNPSSTCYNRNCCVDWVPCGCKSFVIDRITKQKYRIADALGLNIDEFRTTGFEDIEIDINWVKMCTYNANSCTWPMFVLTPFMSLGFTFPSGKESCHSKLFSLPLGNDGHWSYGIESGIDIDFAETIAIGASAGFTGFTPRNHRHFPAPTDQLQTGIYPELVIMRVHPGLNWDFSLYMNAYHFLDRLSAFVQYAVVGHDKDEFTPLSCQDPTEPLDLCALRDRSAWRFHMVNGSLNYDLAPCLAIGVEWQIPVWQQNAYQSTTIILSLQATY